MGRWTQYDEDDARLPEGMKRVGYDSDTRRYTFQDRDGVLYQSEPGNEYGMLTPVERAREANIQRARPNAFEPSKPAKPRTTLVTNSNLTSFEEFLPSKAITSPPPSPPKRSMFSPTSTSDSRLPEVFRKVRAMTATVSRMQTSKSEGPKYHNKSSSLPSPSTSNYHRSPSPPLPPSRLNRNYTQKREFRKKDEDTKGLLRSKTMSSRISVESSSSSSSRQQSSRPSRTSSQASRVSTVSTTSTITPMKTR